MVIHGSYLDELSHVGLAHTNVMEGVIRESRNWPDEIHGAKLQQRASGACSANNELGSEAA